MGDVFTRKQQGENEMTGFLIELIVNCFRVPPAYAIIVATVLFIRQTAYDKGIANTFNTIHSMNESFIGYMTNCF